jgi:hypothetical protein
MTDVWFVVAGYTVILGGLALYAGLLVLRLREARRTAAGMQRQGLRVDDRDDRSGAPPADLPA